MIFTKCCSSYNRWRWSGLCWTIDRIAFMEVPLDLFPFLFVIVVNGVELTIMCKAVMFWSCGRRRKLWVVMVWNAMMIGDA